MLNELKESEYPIMNNPLLKAMRDKNQDIKVLHDKLSECFMQSGSATDNFLDEKTLQKIILEPTTGSVRRALEMPSARKKNPNVLPEIELLRLAWEDFFNENNTNRMSWKKMTEQAMAMVGYDLSCEDSDSSKIDWDAHKKAIEKIENQQILVASEEAMVMLRGAMRVYRECGGERDTSAWFFMVGAYVMLVGGEVCEVRKALRKLANCSNEDTILAYQNWVPNLVLQALNLDAPVSCPQKTIRDILKIWKKVMPNISANIQIYDSCPIKKAHKLIQDIYEKSCIYEELLTYVPPLLKEHDISFLNGFRRDMTKAHFDIDSYGELPKGVKNFILALRSFEQNRKRRNLLLWGPPGSGKTCLAQAIGKSFLDIPFFEVNSRGLLSSTYSLSAQLIDQVFEQASCVSKDTGKPVLMFFDEIDAILRIQNKQNDIQEVQKVYSTLSDNIKNCSNVFIVAAINKIEWIDENIQSLFHVKIHLDKPSPEDLARELKYYLKYLLESGEEVDTFSEDQYLEIANFAQGFDRRAMALIIRDAIIDRRKITSSNMLPIVKSTDLELCIAKVQIRRSCDKVTVCESCTANNMFEVKFIMKNLQERLNNNSAGVYIYWRANKHFWRLHLGVGTPTSTYKEHNRLVLSVGCLGSHELLYKKTVKLIPSPNANDQAARVHEDDMYLSSKWFVIYPESFNLPSRFEWPENRSVHLDLQIDVKTNS